MKPLDDCSECFCAYDSISAAKADALDLPVCIASPFRCDSFDDGADKVRAIWFGFHGLSDF
jgi:hypothetical protein